MCPTVLTTANVSIRPGPTDVIACLDIWKLTTNALVSVLVIKWCISVIYRLYIVCIIKVCVSRQQNKHMVGNCKNQGIIKEESTENEDKPHDSRKKDNQVVQIQTTLSRLENKMQG